MKKTPKLFLLVLGIMLSASFVACNNDDKKETPKDSVVTPKMDSMPVVPDSSKGTMPDSSKKAVKMDNANGKPIVDPH
jgi:hypothetical protein